jgi:hypothetical protein
MNYSKEELLLILLPGSDHRSRRRGDTGRDILETTRLMIDELQQRRGAVDTASGYGPPK